MNVFGKEINFNASKVCTKKMCEEHLYHPNSGKIYYKISTSYRLDVLLGCIAASARCGLLLQTE